MALVLGVEIGKSIYIGNRKVTLVDIIAPNLYKISVDGPMIQVYEISERERLEVLPNVYLQAGRGGNMKVVKFSIEAPKNIVILREKLYRENV